MAVSHDDVRNIAALARVAVDPAQLDVVARELNSILAHMDALAELPPSEIDDRQTAGMRLSPDAGPPVPLVRPPSDFAPNWRDGFFLVPRLATHSDAGAVADETE